MPIATECQLGNLFPGFQVSWFPRFPGFLCFLGFQVSYEPKATWKPRNHRKPGNLGNQETWKPGKRFPSSQVSRVPGFLGSQVSRFPRFPGFLGFLGKLGNLGTWKPGNLKNLETWKPFSRFPGSQVWQGPNPDRLDLDLISDLS